MSYQPGMEQRKNLYLIFKETINNAARHSGCKNVRVDFYSSGNNLHLKITDDGKGFDTDVKSQGNGLRVFQVGKCWRLEQHAICRAAVLVDWESPAV
jgi:signal transduction histidine kinase